MFSNGHVQFIHEPARLQLLLSLACVKQTDFTFLLNSTGLSRGNLSVQMSKLKDKELVTINKMFKNNKSYTVYEITPRGRKTLKRYKKEILAILEGC